MPSGLDDDSLALLESANDNDVQVSTVNIMTMNYGESYDGDMGDYALTSAKATHTQLKEVFGLSDAGAWRGMALTSMIGVNDVDNETFSLVRRGAGADVRGGEGDRVGVDVVDVPGPAVRERDVRYDDAATDCSGVAQSAGAFGEAFAGLSSGARSADAPLCPRRPRAGARVAITGHACPLVEDAAEVRTAACATFRRWPVGAGARPRCTDP